MQFNFFIYILAFAAVVHGAAIGSRSYAQMAKPKPNNPPSAPAPSSGVATSTVPKKYGYRCGSVTYPIPQISLTIAHANALADNSVGPATDPTNRKYPHRFNNRENIPFPGCANAVYTEFPLKTSGTYAGEADKGADRVVYVKGSGKFCGCIHHSTASDFVACTLVTIA